MVALAWFPAEEYPRALELWPTLATEGAPEVASAVDGPEPEGATVTGITPGDRRRSGSSRASA